MYHNRLFRKIPAEVSLSFVVKRCCSSAPYGSHVGSGRLMLRLQRRSSVGHFPTSGIAWLPVLFLRSQSELGGRTCSIPLSLSAHLTPLRHLKLCLCLALNCHLCLSPNNACLHDSALRNCQRPHIFAKADSTRGRRMLSCSPNSAFWSIVEGCVQSLLEQMKPRSVIPAPLF